MKKNKYLIILMMFVVLAVGLTGCGTTYEKATGQPSNNDIAGGYFTEVYKWGGTLEDSIEYTIVYAKDTKVKYLIMKSQHRGGITPLYNADGSLQIYEGE